MYVFRLMSKVTNFDGKKKENDPIIAGHWRMCIRQELCYGEVLAIRWDKLKVLNAVVTFYGRKVQNDRPQNSCSARPRMFMVSSTNSVSLHFIEISLQYLCPPLQDNIPNSSKNEQYQQRIFSMSRVTRGEST